MSVVEKLDQFVIEENLTYLSKDLGDLYLHKPNVVLCNHPEFKEYLIDFFLACDLSESEIEDIFKCGVREKVIDFFQKILDENKFDLADESHSVLEGFIKNVRYSIEQGVSKPLFENQSLFKTPKICLDKGFVAEKIRQFFMFYQDVPEIDYIEETVEGKRYKKIQNGSVIDVTSLVEILKMKLISHLQNDDLANVEYIYDNQKFTFFSDPDSGFIVDLELTDN